MLLIWLVGAAFLYWPFRKWEATYKAPIISALLWPVMVIFFLGFIVWEKIFHRDNNVSTEKEVLTPQQAGKILSEKILQFTSNSEEILALAKQLLIHAEVDFKHEYYYPRGINPNIKNDIDFSMHSRKFLNFYNAQQLEAEAHENLLSSIDPEDYDPRDYSDKNLDHLDLFEITHIFNSMVSRFNDPKAKFQAKLLIIDGMLQ
ncbi:hypothetical protein [Acinetobacter sp. ANC 3791]|uniref:hypothetical protein n=1 Tax=Acinetobacter sp. ANC 3791 TaxID=2529836 RepID=UPI00103EF935|nr:hypothetical protein [Acinetobacter sp. ANC 3791]TCB80895.1 hypothetical protein E0H90_15375 [Acinetobacter sp. ANC 3791]